MDFVVKQRAGVFRTSEFPTFQKPPQLGIGNIYVTSGQPRWLMFESGFGSWSGWKLPICATLSRLSSIAGWWHLILVWCGSEGDFESPVNSCHDHGCCRRVPVPGCSPEAPILSTKVYNISPRTKRALPTHGAAVKSLALCFFFL